MRFMLAEKILGIRRIDKLRSYISSNGVDFAFNKLEELVRLLEALDIIVLKDYANP